MQLVLEVRKVQMGFRVWQVTKEPLEPQDQGAPEQLEL